MRQSVLLRQFFIWILLANLIGIALMAGVGYLALDRSTQQSMSDLQAGKLARAAKVVAMQYDHTSSWDDVIDNKVLWWSLTSPFILIPNPDGSPLSEKQMLRFHKKLQKPDKFQPVDGENNRVAKKNRADKPPHKLKKERASLAERAERLLLYDAQGNLLRGNPEFESYPSTQAEVIVKGEVVGWLRRPQVSKDSAMVKQGVWDGATKTLLWGLLITLVLALLVAYTISRTLTRPMLRISAVLRQLASGRFEVRLPPLKNKAYQHISEDVNVLGNALAEGQETRQRWISDISHELRTPITIINAEIESAEAGIQGSSDDMLQSMREEVTQLNTLINDLKTLSHSDLGGLVFERDEINASRFLNQYAGKVESAAEKHELGFEFHSEFLTPELTLFTDEQRLRQVLDNLLQNTLRYTDKRGTVRLSASRVGQSLSITWEDSEPAVPDTALPRLFDRLYRVEESRNRATGGSGLGLSICKTIVNAQGGTISARHSELGGLAIDVVLPLESIKPEQAEQGDDSCSVKPSAC